MEKLTKQSIREEFFNNINIEFGSTSHDDIVYFINTTITKLLAQVRPELKYVSRYKEEFASDVADKIRGYNHAITEYDSRVRESGF